MWICAIQISAILSAKFVVMHLAVNSDERAKQQTANKCQLRDVLVMKIELGASPTLSTHRNLLVSVNVPIVQYEIHPHSLSRLSHFRRPYPHMKERKTMARSIHPSASSITFVQYSLAAKQLYTTYFQQGKRSSSLRLY